MPCLYWLYKYVLVRSLQVCDSSSNALLLWCIITHFLQLNVLFVFPFTHMSSILCIWSNFISVYRLCIVHLTLQIFGMKPNSTPMLPKYIPLETTNFWQHWSRYLTHVKHHYNVIRKYFFFLNSDSSSGRYIYIFQGCSHHSRVV